jgi:hypothetical protein
MYGCIYYAIRVLINEHHKSMKKLQKCVYNRGHMDYFAIRNSVYGILAICSWSN